MFELSAHGPDVHVGAGPQYPWGGLYGGQIVAQSLRAAALSVPTDLLPHSIRAYFIRRGDATEPVRYEVDRIRNGRSFSTRRVVARQAIGAILNAESSFQRPERSTDAQTVTMPEVPPAEVLPQDSWSPSFERAYVPPEHLVDSRRDGAGRRAAWMRVTDPITAHGTADHGRRDVVDRDGDERESGDLDTQLLHRCWLAFLSDDLPTDAVIGAHPDAGDPSFEEHRFTASLDHTVWFHRPIDASAWHLHDFSCLHLVGGRGLSLGHVFTAEGVHAATIAQEVLVRDPRQRD